MVIDEEEVVDIIKKYNLSGNGSDMARHHFDEECIGGAEDTQESYG